MNYTVTITYANGSQSAHPFLRFLDAKDFCNNGISYSGGRVSRVEVQERGGCPRAMWDESWNDISKHAGLNA